MNSTGESEHLCPYVLHEKQPVAAEAFPHHSFTFHRESVSHLGHLFGRKKFRAEQIIFNAHFTTSSENLAKFSHLVMKIFGSLYSDDMPLL